MEDRLRCCVHCRAEFVAGHEPDPCLGRLRGVAHACCGHGDCRLPSEWVDADMAAYPYCVFGDYPNQAVFEIADCVTLWGRAALAYFEWVGRGPSASLVGYSDHL